MGCLRGCELAKETLVTKALGLTVGRETACREPGVGGG